MSVFVASLLLLLAGCVRPLEVDGTCWKPGELASLFGRYDIVDAVRYRGGLTGRAGIASVIGTPAVIDRQVLEVPGQRLRAPVYAASCLHHPAEGEIATPLERHAGFDGRVTRVVEVRGAASASREARLAIGVAGDELRLAYDGWMLRLRKARPEPPLPDRTGPSIQQEDRK
jgi:hypothetical protein